MKDYSSNLCCTSALRTSLHCSQFQYKTKRPHPLFFIRHSTEAIRHILKRKAFSFSCCTLLWNALPNILRPSAAIPQSDPLDLNHTSFNGTPKSPVEVGIQREKALNDRLSATALKLTGHDRRTKNWGQIRCSLNNFFSPQPISSRLLKHRDFLFTSFFLCLFVCLLGYRSSHCYDDDFPITVFRLQAYLRDCLYGILWRPT